MVDLEEEFNTIMNRLDINDENRDVLITRLVDYTENSHLDLSDLGLSSIPGDIFKDNETILHLNLSNNHFEKIPEELFQPLHQLLSLVMSYCMSPVSLNEDEPVTLPESIFKSQLNLLLLDLSGNQIEFLPDGIFDSLYNVETINLSYNLLALLPVSIGNAINLEELYLESNFFPIEFKDVYSDYIDVQDFIAPFSGAWAVMNNPIDMINEIGLNDADVEDTRMKSEIADQLKNMFKD